jgi:hypothetical protein
MTLTLYGRCKKDQLMQVNKRPDCGTDRNAFDPACVLWQYPEKKGYRRKEFGRGDLSFRRQ